jgi:hypothetical protein
MFSPSSLETQFKLPSRKDCTMSVYLRLIHGRRNPGENLNDWGFSGPTQGPFEAIHVTYLSSLRCIREDLSELELKFHGDLLVHDGCYYGDFEISAEPPSAGEASTAPPAVSLAPEAPPQSEMEPAPAADLPVPIPEPADEAFIEPRRQGPIYRALAELKICKLHVSYSGSGDSGCISDITAFNEDNNPISLPDLSVPVTLTHTDFDFSTGQYSTSAKSVKTMGLPEAVEHWCYDLLEEHFPGWEINDGSDGTIVIDPQTRSGEIEHHYLERAGDCRSFQ